MSRYSYQTKTTTSSQLLDDNKRKSNLLKNNSWIKRDVEEEEDIDRDPNFGRSVLGRYSTSETVTSGDGVETKTTTTTVNKTSSVSALTKRFSGSYDEPKSSTLPSSRTSSSYTRSSYSSLTSPTRTTFTEDPKTSTTTTVTKDGKTTETITSTQTLRSSKSPKTETFSERVLSSSKGYTSYSPTKTTNVTETTVSSNSDAEDKLYDTLIPSSIKNSSSPTESKRTVYTTEAVTIKSSGDTNAENKLYDTLIPKSITDDVTDSKSTVTSTEWVSVKSSPDIDTTRTSTRTSSTAEDALYDTLLPKGITSPTTHRTSSITQREILTLESSRGDQSSILRSPSSTSRISSYTVVSDDSPITRTSSYTISTKPSEEYSSETKRYSYTKPDSSYEYSSITSPSSYSSTQYRSSRSDDINGDSVFSRSSTKSLYSPQRTLTEKDLCSYCHKPFNGDAKMILNDLNVNCHAFCFKCEVCNCTLGHLKAGDSMWIYKRMVHCENCFEVTREKWRR
ncbi:sciellin isoform X2 [Cynoglossus semilaevis]|uniref:sciellin isoform X2 n=1 Tax=Cynoglossus semilaevis TaxID=244447 RepID=UPI0004977022|nr:sciellin isoform X2 [Cynoglossus semilaevis]